MAEQLPGDGLFGWLGRQVAHVKKAVKADVNKPKPLQGGQAAATPVGGAAGGSAGASVSPPAEQVLYRDEKAEEVELPDRPGVRLRRTIIDEVIVDEDGQAKEKGDGRQ